MKAYTIETTEVKTSNITPLEGNIVNINSSLNIGEEGTTYTIYLNGKKLNEASILNKLDKRGDTMSGTLIMGESANIDASQSDIIAKNLTVSGTLAVNNINVLGIINTKADNNDYIDFKESATKNIENLKNKVANKVNASEFEEKLASKADLSALNIKANQSDVENLATKTNDLEYTVSTNTRKINSLQTNFDDHIDSQNHIHLTATDRENITLVQSKADAESLHALETKVDEKADADVVEDLTTEVNVVKSDVEELKTDVAKNKAKINCINDTIADHLDVEKHIHLTTDDNTKIASIQNKADKTDLDVLDEKINNKANASAVDDLIQYTDKLKIDVPQLQIDVDTNKNKISILEDKIETTIDIDNFNIVKNLAYKNSDDIGEINTALNAHIDPKKHFHLTASDIEEINKVKDKAYQFDVDLLNTYIVEIRCNIEKIWEEIRLKGVTHLVTIPHNDIENSSYIDGNILYLDINLNKATEISDEETKVAPTNLIKTYVDELVSRKQDPIMLVNSSNDDINDNSKIESNILTHDFSLNKVDKINDVTKESSLAPKTSGLIDFLEPENNIQKLTGETQSTGWIIPGQIDNGFFYTIVNKKYFNGIDVLTNVTAYTNKFGRSTKEHFVYLKVLQPLNNQSLDDVSTWNVIGVSKNGFVPMYPSYGDDRPYYQWEFEKLKLDPEKHVCFIQVWDKPSSKAKEYELNGKGQEFYCICGNRLADDDISCTYHWDGKKSRIVKFTFGGYKSDEIYNHIYNPELHTTTMDRDYWDAKTDKSYVDERDNYVISLIKNTSFLVVPADEHGYPDVPEADRKENIIYLVKDSSSTETENYYIEWIWVKHEDDVMHWEKIGSTKMDLTGYATEKYVDDTVATHASSNIHISNDERNTWNNKQDVITPSGDNGDDITTTLSFENDKLVSKASLNSIDVIDEDTASSTKVPQTQAVVDYIAKVTPDVSNFVEKTGDTMTGPLKIENTYIKLYDKDNPNKYTGLTNNYIEVSDTNSISENLFDLTSINKDFITCSTIDNAGNPQSFVLLDSTGDLSASNSLTTITTNTYYIESSFSNHDVIVNDNLKIVNERNAIAPDGSEYPITCGLFTNYIQPYNGNKITFLSFGENELDIIVTNTSRFDAESPVIKLTASQNDCDITLAGKSVYGHITDKHSHLTDSQLNVLDAAEHGCFIYKPSEPDPDHPDEPYKGVNPKLVLKNNESTGYREAALQVDYSNGSAIEIKKNEDGTYSAGITTGNHKNGNKIEVTDDGVLIASSYFGPQAVSTNTKTTIMGDTAIGDATTSYKFTVNGKDIASHVSNTNIHVLESEKNEWRELLTNSSKCYSYSLPSPGSASEGRYYNTFAISVDKSHIKGNKIKALKFKCSNDSSSSLESFFKDARLVICKITNVDSDFDKYTNWDIIGKSLNTQSWAINEYKTWYFDDLIIDPNYNLGFYVIETDNNGNEIIARIGAACYSKSVGENSRFITQDYKHYSVRAIAEIVYKAETINKTVLIPTEVSNNICSISNSYTFNIFNKFACCYINQTASFEKLDLTNIINKIISNDLINGIDNVEYNCKIYIPKNNYEVICTTERTVINDTIGESSGASIIDISICMPLKAISDTTDYIFIKRTSFGNSNI